MLLPIILNILNLKQKFITEEQAGFRAKTSTLEQVFNLGFLGEKYLDHQKELYYVVIDFKKAFDREWYEALWATITKYNVNPNLIDVIRQFYQKAYSAVYYNGSVGDWFRTTVGVH